MSPTRAALWIVIPIAAAALLFPPAQAAKPAAAPATDNSYQVQPHDTLWEIAERNYDGDPRAAVDEIQAANGLTSSLIVPGQTLTLP